jgi:hypothetical protein
MPQQLCTRYLAKREIKHVHTKKKKKRMDKEISLKVMIITPKFPKSIVLTIITQSVTQSSQLFCPYHQLLPDLVLPHQFYTPATSSCLALYISTLNTDSINPPNALIVSVKQFSYKIWKKTIIISTILQEEGLT